MTLPETQAMLKWLNQNRRMLRQSYPNQYVAYNAEGMVAHAESSRGDKHPKTLLNQGFIALSLHQDED